MIVLRSVPAVIFFSVFVFFYLLLLPVFCDMHLVMAADRRAPEIVFSPSKVARYGETYKIVTHIGDESSLQAVHLVLQMNGKTRRGKMRRNTSSGRVPVIVRARRDASVYAGPGSGYQGVGVIRSGERLRVSQIRGNYLQVITASGETGYISSKHVEVIGSGYLYSVTLPGAFTERSSLTFQIEAIDASGNRAITDATQVMFLTPLEINELFADQQSMPAALGGSRPVYKRVWFWLVLLAVGGGTYYWLSQNQSDPKGTVDVLVEWE